MSIRNEIAEAVNDHQRSGYGSYVPPGDIVKAEFRKGCAEIEVTYNASSGDYEYVETATIDAAPILSTLLAWALHAEVTHDD